ncbi:MAG: peptidylprolyl isomerase [Anaerolineae bacterium]|nr:peptidylprolyl isomerase [Anaerolineae bacterium]MCO5189602.1 peptidylprolyl isomerase [Anaerolineae bacterium]
MSEKVVAQDMVIGINYVLRLDDGTIIDQAAADDPLLYLHGHGNIISGLESELTGLQVGDRKSVTVEPTDAYGEYNPDDVEQHPRDMFPADMDLAEDMALELRDPETDNTYEAIITAVNDKVVTLDFNHPLAGETLYFDVIIVSVRPASAEEIEHGHVHAEHSHAH